VGPQLALDHIDHAGTIEHENSRSQRLSLARTPSDCGTGASSVGPESG
jgi:hypothetical protein